MSFPAFLLWLLRRWYFWTFVVLAVLVVSAVSWYYSDADLRAVDERAKALGVPLEWKDFPVKPISPEKQTQLQRIFDLQKELGCYSESDEVIEYPIRQFQPLPQEMLNFHAKMDPQKIKDMYQEIDALTPDSFRVWNDVSLKPIIYTTGGLRSLTRFLQERILLAPSEDLGPTCRRLLAVLQNRNTGSLLDVLVNASLVGLTTSAISQRLPDLVLHDPALADELLRCAEQLEQEMPLAMVGGFLSERQIFEFKRTQKQNPAIVSALAVLSGTETLPAWLMPLVHRCGRKQVFSDILDTIVAHRNTHSLKELLEVVRQREKGWIQAEEYRKTYNKYLRLLLFPNRAAQDFACGRASEEILPSQVLKNAMHLRLIAAEIRKTPWPSDIFSPTDAALKRVERDGKLMGVYSVGMNGVDDGGQKGIDMYLSLYGPQFPPKPIPSPPKKSNLGLLPP